MQVVLIGKEHLSWDFLLVSWALEAAIKNPLLDKSKGEK